MIASIFIILICVLLIGVILIQNSKGGGIQSQFGAATQIMGVKRGTELVERLTWGLIILIIILSVIMSPKSSIAGASEQTIESATKKKAATSVAIPQQSQPQQQAAQPVQPGQATPPSGK